METLENNHGDDVGNLPRPSRNDPTVTVTDIRPREILIPIFKVVLESQDSEARGIRPTCLETHTDYQDS